MNRVGIVGPTDGRRRIRWPTLLCLALGLAPVGGTAQSLPLKPSPAVAVDGVCPALASAGASRAAPGEVDSLVAAGSRAAIAGDLDTAERILREAAGLDPGSRVASYRLARTLDDRGEAELAALEYCRYLTLAPDAPDAPDVRSRVEALTSDGGFVVREPGWAEMAAGLIAMEAGRYDEAVAAFTLALNDGAERSAAHYNRAVALLVSGRTEEAVLDLQAYLRLAPSAEDAPRVRAELDRIAHRATVAAAAGDSAASSAPDGGRHLPAPADLPVAALEPKPADAGSAAEAPSSEVEAATQLALGPAPGSALVQGLLVPGLGQHATGRTTLGVAVLGAVAGALYVGMLQEQVSRRAFGEDPFGNRYEYDVLVLERPYLGPAIGAAVAIGVGAALESYLYARRRKGAGPLRSGFLPSAATPLGARLTLGPARGGLRLDLLFLGGLPDGT